VTHTIDRRRLLERGGVIALATGLFAGYTAREASASTTTMPPPSGGDDSAALQNALTANGEVRFDAYPGQPYNLASVMVPSHGRGTRQHDLQAEGRCPEECRRELQHLLNAGWEGGGDTDITIEGIEFDGNVLINHASEQTAGCQWYGTRRMGARLLFPRLARGGHGVACPQFGTRAAGGCTRLERRARQYGSNADGGWAGNRRQGLFVKADRNITFQGITARRCYSFTIDLEGGKIEPLVGVPAMTDGYCTVTAGLVATRVYPLFRNSRNS
jgi:hypothetical protein